MRLKEVCGKVILDSRREKTIQAIVKTEKGVFTASSPSGKSKGRNEKPAFIKNVENDIETIRNFSEKISELNFGEFSDLSKMENMLRGKIGANTLFALETAVLKALASDRKEGLWQLINPRAKKIPFPAGNCIGGGLHSQLVRGLKPDFQEFLIMPKTNRFSDNVFLMRKAWKICGEELKVRRAEGKLNDENAFSTCLSNEEVLEIMQRVKEELEEQVGKEIYIGADIAASSFYTGLIYNYKNFKIKDKKRLNKKEQADYILDLVDKYNIDYIEDPLQEEDFLGFSYLRGKMVRARPTSIIVGDDLTVSSLDRFKKALNMKSINAIILKPNQTGSLLEIAEIVRLAKKYALKTVMSHRSGETFDNALADLSFAFQTDYIKTGITGKEREAKLRRLIEIEKNMG
ncbi:MAG: enolase C-terminal domain-like protein [Nanoarchaeota archaeon]